jgi:AcrR family transcriptional regulator
MTASSDHGTRERILEVAEGFLGQCGYNGTRLHLIAQRVGIQKASLFHYFPSKEHLYRAVVDEGFGETEATIRRVIETEGTPLQKVRLLVEAYVDMVAAHPDRTKILLRQSLGDAPDGYQPIPDSQRLLGAVVKFIADGQQAQVFAPIDPLALLLGIVGMVAFFFTSAPVLAPAWCGDPWGPSNVARVKQHVVEVVQRCLTAGITAPKRAVA